MVRRLDAMTSTPRSRAGASARSRHQKLEQFAMGFNLATLSSQHVAFQL